MKCRVGGFASRKRREWGDDLSFSVRDAGFKGVGWESGCMGCGLCRELELELELKLKLELEGTMTLCVGSTGLERGRLAFTGAR